MGQRPTVRERTNEAIKSAREGWDGAPLHIKKMAGAYVEPLLDALNAINHELDYIREVMIDG